MRLVRTTESLVTDIPEPPAPMAAPPPEYWAHIPRFNDEPRVRHDQPA